MNNVRCVLFYLIIIPISCSVERFKGRNRIKETAMTNYSIANVDARLGSSGSSPDNDGIIQLMLPSSNQHRAICFPFEHYDEQKQGAILAHVVCRQLGFMTFTSRYKQTSILGEDSKALLPSSSQCIGHEQSTSHCPWKNVAYDYCRIVMAVQCGTCHRIIKSNEGVINSPGYPHAYLYTVLCEWSIVVPEDHTIVFTFHQLNLPQGREISVACDGYEPYVELVYGYHDEGHNIRRYCIFNKVRNVSVPFRQAKVRFFSGLYYQVSQDASKKYGFSLAFKAVPEVDLSSQSVKLVIIAIGFILFCLVILSFYFCRNWSKSYRRSQRRLPPRVPNAPTREQIDRPNAVLFEKCRSHRPPQGVQGASLSDSNLNTPNASFPCFTAPSPPPDRVRHASSQTPLTTISAVIENPTISKPSCISKLKTKLISKFTPSVCESNGSKNSKSASSRLFDVDVPRPKLSFQIYRSETSSSTSVEKNVKISVPDDPATESSDTKVEDGKATTEPKMDIPSIVVEFVDDVFSERKNSGSSH